MCVVYSHCTSVCGDLCCVKTLLQWIVFRREEVDHYMPIHFIPAIPHPFVHELNRHALAVCDLLLAPKVLQRLEIWAP